MQQIIMKNGNRKIAQRCKKDYLGGFEGNKENGAMKF